MPRKHGPVSTRTLSRIYQEEIAPVLLGTMKPSRRPTALFILGTQGAGKEILTLSLAKKLTRESGSPALLMLGDLLAYHPQVRTAKLAITQLSKELYEDIRVWFSRLWQDCLLRRANAVIDMGLPHPTYAAQWCMEAHQAGHRVEVMVPASHEARSRRVLIGHYLLALESGVSMTLEHLTQFDEITRGIGALVKHLEENAPLDAIHIVTSEGRMLYTNSRIDGHWTHNPTGADVYARHVFQRMTPTELAQNAIAWHQLTTRAQQQSKISSTVMSQALTWRAQASDQALADPSAAQRYQCMLVADSFRSMPLSQFQREFPDYAGVAKRFERANAFAMERYLDATARETFLATSRERLALTIEQGRRFHRRKTPDPSKLPIESKARKG